MSQWYEKLPPDCPPEDAMVPDGGTVFFRLVSTMPPSEEDFIPPGRQNPERDFGVQGCKSLSLSILDRLDGTVELLKLPTQRGKSIVALSLDADAGSVKRTGKRLGHFSWWRRADFDAPGASQGVE